MAVRWSQAQRRAARHWRRVADGIGRRDPLAVVAELNETSALCELACEEAGGDAGRCGYCVVFENARQCVDARMEISSMVMGGDLDGARTATMAIVERIAAAEPPGLP